MRNKRAYIPLFVSVQEVYQNLVIASTPKFSRYCRRLGNLHTIYLHNLIHLQPTRPFLKALPNPNTSCLFIIWINSRIGTVLSNLNVLFRNCKQLSSVHICQWISPIRPSPFSFHLFIPTLSRFHDNWNSFRPLTASPSIFLQDRTCEIIPFITRYGIMFTSLNIAWPIERSAHVTSQLLFTFLMFLINMCVCVYLYISSRTCFDT